MSPINVADVRSNLNENIIHAVDTIGRSSDRRAVFEAIYRGKKNIKTVDEISELTGLNRTRVLQEGQKLFANHIVGKFRKDNQVAYQKDQTYTAHKNKILRLVDNPSKKSILPTKQSPKVNVPHVRITIKSRKPRIVPITVDDVDSFSKVKVVGSIDNTIRLSTIKEEEIKKGLKKIIGEKFDYKDWGGEKNDLYTNKLKFKGKRRNAAFALKGKATKGKLTPGKMGVNGDQISRLASSPAELLFVVYHSKIDESIIEQLQAFSLGKAMVGKTIYYGIIDGTDLNRLYQAYREYF